MLSSKLFLTSHPSLLCQLPWSSGVCVLELIPWGNSERQRGTVIVSCTGTTRNMAVGAGGWEGERGAIPQRKIKIADSRLDKKCLRSLTKTTCVHVHACSLFFSHLMIKQKLKPWIHRHSLWSLWGHRKSMKLKEKWSSNLILGENALFFKMCHVYPQVSKWFLR